MAKSSLTFDDGPMKSDTRPILKALADQCTKATFFEVGQMALADPELVKEVAAGGHTIGTHTWSHVNIRAVSLARAEREIEAAISTVSKAKGTLVAPLFRFPYLNATKQAEDYLKSRNIAAVWVDIDSKDYLSRSPKVVEQRILAQLTKEKKGIILMHDIHAWTAAMVPDLLKDLHDRGFKVVHIVPKGQIETIASYDAAGRKSPCCQGRSQSGKIPWHPVRSYGPCRPRPLLRRRLTLPWLCRQAPGTSLLDIKRVSTKPVADSVSEERLVLAPQPAKYKKTGKSKNDDAPWSFFN